MKIHNWRKFYEKITKSEMSEDDQILAQQRELMKPVFLDISPFLYDILTPHKAIIQSRIDAIEMRKRKDNIIAEQQEYLKKNART